MSYGQMIILRKGPSQKVEGTIWSWSCIVFPTPTYLNTHCAASPQFPGKLGMIFDLNQGYQIHFDNLETFYVLVCCKYAFFLSNKSFLISTGVKDHTWFIFTFGIYSISFPCQIIHVMSWWSLGRKITWDFKITQLKRTSSSKPPCLGSIWIFHVWGIYPSELWSWNLT